MSDNQRNTTTNESDSDTAGAAGVSDVETAEKDTVEEASETGKTEEETPGSTGVAETAEATGSGKAAEATKTPKAKWPRKVGKAGKAGKTGKAEAVTEVDETEETGKPEEAASATEAASVTGTASATEAAKAEEVTSATEAEETKEPESSEKKSEGTLKAGKPEKTGEKPKALSGVFGASAGPSDTASGPSEKDSVVEDRAEAGGTPVTENKASSAPEGPKAVKAKLSSRKAHLTVSRVEPWSVMKFSFVISLVCFIILFVAVAVIYATLSMLGVFEELTNMLGALLEGDAAGGEGELGLDPASWFSPGRVLGYTGVVGALNIVLITALSTVGAMLYNLVADLVGGVDVTLSEAE